MVIILT